jgi:hypothetical protein
MNILNGYQKSGTEWVKFILTNIFCGPQSTWVDYNICLPNLVIGADAPSGWHKSHKIEFEGDKAIHLVRHPFDTIISAYRYRAVIDNVPVPDIGTYIDYFIEHNGDHEFNRINGGSLVEHFRFWQEQDHTFSIAHEILRSEGGPHVIFNVLRILDFSVTKIEVVEAFKLASVERMRELDTTEFLGQVTVGQWQDHFTSLQRKKGYLAFRPIFDKMGYTA